MKCLPLFFLFFSMNVFAQPFTGLFENIDIVFYGENHFTDTHLDPVLETLEAGLAAGKIDTFATEYVPGDLNEDFQRYLSSPTATPNSTEESEFFSKIDDRGLMWPQMKRNRDFYRRLRELKLEYSEDLKICGVDFQQPVGFRSNDSNLNLRMTQFYTELPERLINRLLELSGEESISDLVKDGDSYFREARIALNTQRCFGESRRGIAHLGAFHTHAVKTQMDGWRASSSLFHFLTGRPYFSLSNYTMYAPVEEDNPFARVFQELSIICDFQDLIVIDAEAFPENMSRIISELTVKHLGEDLDLTEYYDAIIFGPLGLVSEEEVDPPYRSIEN